MVKKKYTKRVQGRTAHMTNPITTNGETYNQINYVLIQTRGALSVLNVRIYIIFDWRVEFSIPVFIK